MPGSRRLLIVDDDAPLRQSLAEQLSPEFSAHQAGSGEEALAAARGAQFDAVLLDVGLPDLDGREVCRRLRAQGVAAPILMLTAAAGESDTIAGLDSGANDYIAKPFRLGELLARLRAHLRLYEDSEHAVFQLGPYAFHPADKLLIETASRKKIRLTEKEAAILRFLYRADAQAVSRETLLDEIWGYNSAVDTHTLETHVYRLRQKIERDPAHAVLLVTAPGGYRLVV